MGWWRGRGARRGLLALWAIAVVRLTLWPAPAPDDTFDVVRAVIGWFVDHGIPVTYAGVEAVANVLMFVPFGVLTGLLLVRRWPIVPMAAALSGAIELSQSAVPADPGTHRAGRRAQHARRRARAPGADVVVLARPRPRLRHPGPPADRRGRIAG
ncbi:VanZ family protein [Cellulomonas soli]